MTPKLVKLAVLLRDHGPRKTASVVMENVRHLRRRLLDERFDRAFGVDTSGRVDLKDLVIDSEHRDRGIYYEPTPTRTLAAIFAHLPVDPREYAFIDMGCGKGRVVLFAARRPFKRVIGVEFSPALAATARDNLARDRAADRMCEAVDIACVDATTFRIPDEPCVFYFFNPFEGDVMTKVVDNIAAWRRERSRPFVIVYYHPQHRDVIERLPSARALPGLSLPHDPSARYQRKLAMFVSEGVTA